MTGVNILGVNVENPYTNDFCSLVVPEGLYSFMIVGIKVADDRTRATATLQLLDSKYKDEKIQHTFWLTSTQQGTMPRGLSELRSLCDVFKITSAITDLNIFLNKCFVTRVGHTAAKETKKQNQMTGQTETKMMPERNWISFSIDELKLYGPAQNVQVNSMAPQQQAVPVQNQFTQQEMAQDPTVANAPPPIPGMSPQANNAPPAAPNGWTTPGQ